jgi:hypothetical protein
VVVVVEEEEEVVVAAAVSDGWAQGAPARHLLVRLIALSKLAEVSTTPRVQCAPVGDGRRVETTARNKADALAAQSFKAIRAAAAKDAATSAHLRLL